jgi:dTDP-4-dehydrorhamnose reductase
MLVIGGDGTLGRALVAAGHAGPVAVWHTTRRGDDVGQSRFQLDLADPEIQWRLPQQPFSTVFLSAGVTSIQTCEAQPEVTRRVNVVQPLLLAQRLWDQGAFVVCLSSSTVFDGQTPFATPTDDTKPVSEYGRQKLALERGLLALGERVAIIRLSKVIAPNNALFSGWRNDLLSGQVIRPFSDMAVAPVSLPFAVAAVHHIARSREAGVHHISAAADVSYADLANHMASVLQAPAALVCPRSAAGTHVGFWPKFAALDCSALLRLGFVAPPAISAVDQFLMDALKTRGDC